MPDNTENANDSSRKKGVRASIAGMDYGLGAGLAGAGNVGMGKAARRIVSGPLSNSEAKIVELNQIDSNPGQPRTHFDEATLKELAEDIKERGVLQPPLVRDSGNGRYEIVAGERRCRAARLAGLTEIPVIIKEFKSEQEVKLASLAENLQRDDLDIEDEARFLNILQKEMKLSLRQIAEVIHRSYLYVYRRTTIADEPELIQLYRDGQAGIETLVRIARIPKENRGERERAIAGLRGNHNEERGNLANPSDQGENLPEPSFNVSARNTIRPVQRLTQALASLQPEDITKADKQALTAALNELEGVISQLKRKLKDKVLDIRS